MKTEAEIARLAEAYHAKLNSETPEGVIKFLYEMVLMKDRFQCQEIYLSMMRSAATVLLKKVT